MESKCFNAKGGWIAYFLDRLWRSSSFQFQYLISTVNFVVRGKCVTITSHFLPVFVSTYTVSRCKVAFQVSTDRGNNCIEGGKRPFARVKFVAGIVGLSYIQSVIASALKNPTFPSSPIRLIIIFNLNDTSHNEESAFACCCESLNHGELA